MVEKLLGKNEVFDKPPRVSNQHLGEFDLPQHTCQNEGDKMSVRPKGNKWFADITIDGQRYRKSKDTEVEAFAWESELKRRITLGIPYEDMLEGKTIGLSLREVLDKTHTRYWTNTKNEDNVIYLSKQIETFYGSNLPINSLTTDRIDEYVLSLQKKRISKLYY
jgi:hypothetical protein